MLTDRQKKLLLACIDAELEMNHQGDTTLSLRAAEGKDDPDAALDALQRELRDLAATLRGEPPATKTRRYVFTYNSFEPTMDRDGFYTSTSFVVPASDLDGALAKLATYCHVEFGWGADPADYRDNIECGNVSVYVPTEVG